MTHLHDDQPLAFRRVFPLAQLAEPAEGLPGENGRGLITAAAAPRTPLMTSWTPTVAAAKPQRSVRTGSTGW